MSKASRQAAEEILGECLGLRSRLLSRVITRRFETALRPMGLTGTQLTLLVAIELVQPARPAELGVMLEMEKSTLSRSLSRMQSQEWVRFDSDPRDGRAQRVRLTPEGQRALARARPAWREVQDELVAGLGDSSTSALDRLYRRAAKDT